MSNRRNFTKAVRLAIIKRAMLSDHGSIGFSVCEKCGSPVVRFEIDHRDPDAMQIDKSRKLTAEEGWLLCLPCHRLKTKKDKGDIAKVKRVEARHLGADRPKGQIKSRGFAKRARAHEGRPPVPRRGI